MMDNEKRDDSKDAFDTEFIADYMIQYTDREPPTGQKTKLKRKQKPVNETKMGLYDWLQCIVSAVVAGILIFVFVGRIDGIKGPSMMQTLQNGDTVILSNLFYTPHYKDVVFIKTEAYGDTPIVKRVIATAGQTVDIDFNRGVVLVDGVELQEDYVNTPTNYKEGFEGPQTVPEGHVFVMGDNRNQSLDSRDASIGMVDVDSILGRVYFVLIPGEGYEENRDWKRIGPVH